MQLCADNAGCMHYRAGVFSVVILDDQTSLDSVHFMMIVNVNSMCSAAGFGEVKQEAWHHGMHCLYQHQDTEFCPLTSSCGLLHDSVIHFLMNLNQPIACDLFLCIGFCLRASVVL